MRLLKTKNRPRFDFIVNVANGSSFRTFVLNALVDVTEADQQTAWLPGKNKHYGKMAANF